MKRYIVTQNIYSVSESWNVLDTLKDLYIHFSVFDKAEADRLAAELNKNDKRVYLYFMEDMGEFYLSLLDNSFKFNKPFRFWGKR